jgi:hypothetical protein
LALAPKLDSNQLTYALGVAKAIGDESHRSAALVGLVPYFGGTDRSALMVALLDSGAGVQRANALVAAERSAPLTAALGGPSAVAELYRAIRDVSIWYT